MVNSESWCDTPYMAFIVLETLRCENENNRYEYEIWLKGSSRILLKQKPRIASLYFWLTRKVSTVIFIEGG